MRAKAGDGKETRILVLSLFLPVPADNGVKMRTRAVLRSLAARGHRLSVVAFTGGRDDAAAARRLLRSEVGSDRVELTPVPRPSALASPPGQVFRRLLHLASALPASVTAARSPEFHAVVQRQIGSGGIDAILCEQTDPLVNLPPCPAIPLVVDFHNVESVLYRRYALCTNNPAKRCYARAEARKVTGWETHAARRATLALACSAQDGDWLRRASPGLPVLVAPNVVDTQSYLPAFAEQPDRIVYSGGMDWYPNRDAVRYFAKEILPRIRRDVPLAEFLVAGRNPPQAFRRRIERIASVRFTGAVPDMKAVIGAAALAVVPLRIGSGTRLKILEAAALGKAVVSTSVGAEGLAFRPGEEILLADSAPQFAEAVVDLLRNPDRRLRLGAAARRRVVRDYGTRALQAAVDDALRRVSGVDTETETVTDELPATDLRGQRGAIRQITILGKEARR